MHRPAEEGAVGSGNQSAEAPEIGYMFSARMKAEGELSSPIFSRLRILSGIMDRIGEK